MFLPLRSFSLSYSVYVSLHLCLLFPVFLCMLWECCLDLAKPLIRGLYCRGADRCFFFIIIFPGIQTDGQKWNAEGNLKSQYLSWPGRSKWMKEGTGGFWLTNRGAVSFKNMPEKHYRKPDDLFIHPLFYTLSTCPSLMYITLHFPTCLELRFSDNTPLFVVFWPRNNRQVVTCNSIFRAIFRSVKSDVICLLT